MGLFKGLKGLADVTKSARQLQDQQQVQGGYKPGMRGMMSQMGDMVGTLNEQIKDIAEQSGDQERLLSEGMPGQAVIVAMGIASQRRFSSEPVPRPRGPRQRLGAVPVATSTVVHASSQLGEVVILHLQYDPNNHTNLAIEWANVPDGQKPGEVQPPGRAATKGAHRHRSPEAGNRWRRSNNSPSCTTSALSPRPNSQGGKQRMLGI